MITLEFTNGEKINIRATKMATVISKAIEVSPVKGSIAGTKLINKNGEVFGIIDSNCSWTPFIH